MSPEKAKFTERAVNKFIELVLRQLVDANSLQVRIRARLKELMQGRIDGLTIQMSGFLLQPHLRVATFEFDIGAAAINLKRIKQRQIELVEPATGRLQIGITDRQLTDGLNSLLTNTGSEPESSNRMECAFQADGAIALRWQRNGSEAQTCTVRPIITGDGSSVTLAPQESSEKLIDPQVEQAIARISTIFSLTDLANQGTIFRIQTIEIVAGQATVQAGAEIQQFPSTQPAPEA